MANETKTVYTDYGVFFSVHYIYSVAQKPQSIQFGDGMKTTDDNRQKKSSCVFPFVLEDNGQVTEKAKHNM